MSGADRHRQNLGHLVRVDRADGRFDLGIPLAPRLGEAKPFLGGIDSALVAAIACEALGPENVLCVMMPSPFSSEGSVKHSEELIRNLGCEGRTEPISDTFNALLHQMRRWSRAIYAITGQR